MEVFESEEASEDVDKNSVVVRIEFGKNSEVAETDSVVVSSGGGIVFVEMIKGSVEVSDGWLKVDVKSGRESETVDNCVLDVVKVESCNVNEVNGEFNVDEAKIVLENWWEH